MTWEEMTEQALLVLTEWVHTLASELRREPEPPSPARIAEVAVRCCPEVAQACDVAGAVSAAQAAKLLRPELLLTGGSSAVQRLELALPPLSEPQRDGYFGLLLAGLGDSGVDLSAVDGEELRRRLAALLEEQANRTWAGLAGLAQVGGAGLEPVEPKPMEGVLRDKQLPILSAAVFCTAAEGLLSKSWQWPGLVGVSLAAGEQLARNGAVPRGEAARFSALHANLYSAVLLAQTAVCLRVFATGGGELEVMRTLLPRPEDWPLALARQLYGLLGYVSGFCGPGSETVPEELRDLLRAYWVWLEDRRDGLPAAETKQAAEQQNRTAKEKKREQLA